METWLASVYHWRCYELYKSISHLTCIVQNIWLVRWRDQYKSHINTMTQQVSHQRRSSQKNGTLLPHNDALICHGRNIGTSGCTGAHDNCNLDKQGPYYLP